MKLSRKIALFLTYLLVLFTVAGYQNKPARSRRALFVPAARERFPKMPGKHQGHARRAEFEPTR